MVAFDHAGQDRDCQLLNYTLTKTDSREIGLSAYWWRPLIAGALSCLVASAVLAQAGLPTDAERAAIAAASRAERDRELRLLAITEMQPGATAYDSGKPGNANYDEAKANPYPQLPQLLTMNDGTQVRTAAQWSRRRAEIKELFAEDIYGKFPAHIPAVTWKVERVELMTVQGIAAVVKHITGKVDDSEDPLITVDIHADVVTPAASRGKKIPVIIGGGSLKPRPHFPQTVHQLKAPEGAPDSAELLLKQGWGFVGRDSTEVQADNGAGLDKGLIGLVNKGHPRSLDDWGVLRAWGWGDSRLLDYLETDPDVDAARVGIFGHSRGGKAALLAMADDPRFAIGYISSSGAGGANLYRRDYGERLGNLAGPGTFHWFAGSFLNSSPWWLRGRSFLVEALC
jgi:hypothetical protein